MREIQFWMDPISSPFLRSCESGLISESGQILLTLTNTLTGSSSILPSPKRANPALDQSQPHTVPPSSKSTILDSIIPLEDTFAMIKPVTSETHAEEIFTTIAGHGFQIVQQLHTRLTLQQAEMFYAEHIGKEFFSRLTEYMSSGPVIALHLRRAVAITGWRNLIGPTNLEKAKETRPDSLRAKFGIDGTRNACHGSDSRRSAAREIYFFFSVGGVPPEILPLPEIPETLNSSPTKLDSPLSPVRPPRTVKSMSSSPPGNNLVSSTIPKMSRTDIALMQAYANYDVDPVMKNLLLKLMISRPDDVIDFAIMELNDMKRNPNLTVKRSASFHSVRTTGTHRYDDGDGSIATITAEPSLEQFT